MFTFFFIVLSLAGFSGVFAAKRGYTAGQLVVLASILSLVVLCGWRASRPDQPLVQKGFNDRDSMLSAEALVLGNYLTAQYNQGRVVVLPPVPSPLETTPTRDPGIATLIKSIKGKLDITQAALPDEVIDGNTVMDDTHVDSDDPLAAFINPEELQSFLRKIQSTADVVVMPYNHDTYLRAWQSLENATAPALMLLHAVPGQLENLFKQEIIDAATLFNPPPDARTRLLEKHIRKIEHDYARTLFTLITPGNYRSLFREN